MDFLYVMKPLDPKWWLQLNSETLLHWSRLASRCDHLPFGWSIFSISGTHGRVHFWLCLYAKSSSHSLLISCCFHKLHCFQSKPLRSQISQIVCLLSSAILCLLSTISLILLSQGSQWVKMWGTTLCVVQSWVNRWVSLSHLHLYHRPHEAWHTSAASGCCKIHPHNTHIHTVLQTLVETNTCTHNHKIPLFTSYVPTQMYVLYFMYRWSSFWP